MEEGLNSYIKKQFDIEGIRDVRTVSPLALAYIGDGVFELIVRTVILERNNSKASKLHHMTSQLVKADAQSFMADALMDEFTDEEEKVYHRGRNAKSHTSAKNAGIGEYRKATGFEAVMGYLYLTNNMERAVELTKKGLSLYTPNEKPDREARNSGNNKQ